MRLWTLPNTCAPYMYAARRALQTINNINIVRCTYRFINWNRVYIVNAIVWVILWKRENLFKYVRAHTSTSCLTLPMFLTGTKFRHVPRSIDLTWPAKNQLLALFFWQLSWNLRNGEVAHQKHVFGVVLANADRNRQTERALCGIVFGKPARQFSIAYSHYKALCELGLDSQTFFY